MMCNTTLYFTRGACVSVHVQVCACVFHLMVSMDGAYSISNSDHLLLCNGLVLFPIVILLLEYTGKDPQVQAEVSIHLYH